MSGADEAGGGGSCKHWGQTPPGFPPGSVSADVTSCKHARQHPQPLCQRWPRSCRQPRPGPCRAPATPGPLSCLGTKPLTVPGWGAAVLPAGPRNQPNKPTHRGEQKAAGNSGSAGPPWPPRHLKVPTMVPSLQNAPFQPCQQLVGSGGPCWWAAGNSAGRDHASICCPCQGGRGGHGGEPLLLAPHVSPSPNPGMLCAVQGRGQ